MNEALIHEIKAKSRISFYRRQSSSGWLFIHPNLHGKSRFLTFFPQKPI